MTVTARVVLGDCEAALLELRNNPEGLAWRVRWAAAVALLRATLHVLKKCDSSESPRMASAIDRKWDDLRSSKPDPAIFWLFVEQERNNLLKEYKTSAQQSVTIFLTDLDLRLTTGNAPEPSPPVILQPPRSEYSYQMGAGPFQGRDPRDVVADAIKWLRKYLDDVDVLAAT